MTDRTSHGATEVRGGRAAVRRAAARATRRTRFLLAAILALVVAGGSIFVGNAVGAAATYPQVCDQFGSRGVGGKYVAQNNRWGTDKQQCITPFDTGFTLDVAGGTNNTGPSSYPSLYRGCVYGYCTPGSTNVFPAPVRTLGAVRSNFATTGPTNKATSQYNTAYDIWFDPTATNKGRNTGAEMMIWLNRTSWVQPIGKPYYDVNIGGTVYTVWYGKIDLPVISYVRKTPTTSVSNLPIDLFVRDATNRGVIKNTWYMTSVQAGFEPWTGGQGLKVTNFSVTRNGL
ncbi:GH12 family glycosyl hydrolase domain-containing protein [Actinomycetospora termitidis]|uniref:Glycosyl hydrolase family 12 n=1 Tax=Actinomycetospora termitidis TaxID=3053470 RepID=A0ABT7MD56_9PSEU|nr:hypothetical protein [Actinomycetospora sp. Odt1-22]MDL5157917.1 hypothetical protein [Actinomycetospora sp. Odt1-22]